MTGAPPYNIQSPTQQHRFAVYSPPNKNRPFYPSHDQYQQHPLQSPTAFPPHPALARSPHFPHAPSPLPTTLPPLNGTAPPPPPPRAEAPAQFQPHTPGGPHQLPLPRPYSGAILSANGATPYSHTSPSHAHPASLLESHLQSPKKDHESPFDMRHNGIGYSPQLPMMREPRPPSPPKEVVRPFNTLTVALVCNENSFTNVRAAIETR